jgi:DNA-binding response OmpR family regulator
MRVLVVEDDPSIRETLGMVLEACEYQADLMDSGEKALEYLKGTWPDVMLLDLTLEGMTGEEVYEQIKERFGRVPPTVVLSAVQHAENRVRNLPGASFLGKPYTIEELSAVIEQAVASKGAA